MSEISSKFNTHDLHITEISQDDVRYFVRDTRLRMGWTQSDLARRLNVQLCDVTNWESGSHIPTHHQILEIELIHSHADSRSQELQQQPIVDELLSKNELVQIEVTEIREYLQEESR